MSEMLKAVRLTGSVFLNACFSAPFGVVAPKYYDPVSPMAYLRHISIFHFIVAGNCTFEAANGERREVTAGDLLFLPFAGHHKIWKGEPLVMAEARQIVQPGRIEGMWTVNYGGGGDELRMVCGFLESSEFLFAPVFRTLPALIVEKMSDDKVGALIALTVREIDLHVEAAAPGRLCVARSPPVAGSRVRNPPGIATATSLADANRFGDRYVPANAMRISELAYRHFCLPVATSSACTSPDPLQK